MHQPIVLLLLITVTSHTHTHTALISGDMKKCAAPFHFSKLKLIPVCVCVLWRVVVKGRGKLSAEGNAEALIAFYFSNVGSFSLDGCSGAASVGLCVLLSKFLEKQKISEMNLECLTFRLQQG